MGFGKSSFREDAAGDAGGGDGFGDSRVAGRRGAGHFFLGDEIRLERMQILQSVQYSWPST